MDRELETKPEETPLDLGAHVPARLLVLSARIALHAARLSAKPHGLSIREWRIIQILGSRGASSINDVAATIAMDFGGTSRAISALEARGFVSRKADSDDRRVSYVSLTQSGEKLHVEFAAFARAREERLLASLDRHERDALHVILDKLDREANDMLRETTSAAISGKHP